MTTSTPASGAPVLGAPPSPPRRGDQGGRRPADGHRRPAHRTLVVGGHVLLEGPPGTAKTLLASTFARALGIDFGRVQFTPDLLPTDVTGTVVLRDGELTFRPGPVFTSVLHADEINRTPPKTQAALLEAMQEQQVSVDGEPRPLPIRSS
ncbi:MAG: AAA family ATPase [Acidimicrobiales bacterium]